MEKIRAAKVQIGMYVEWAATHTKRDGDVIARIERRNRRIFLYNPAGELMGSGLGWSPSAALFTNDVPTA